MITAIFTAVTQAITGFAGALAQGFTDIMTIVWDGSGLTTFGILLVIGFGVSVVFYALRKVFELISLANVRK